MDDRLRKLERAWKTEGSAEALQAFVNEAVRCEYRFPVMRLLTRHSKPVRMDGFPENHFAKFEGGDPVDLGEEVITTFLNWWPKAIRFSDDGINEVSYDMSDPLFKEIVNDAKNYKHSAHAMHGPEFLVVVGLDIMTLFFGTKSAARALQHAGGPNLRGQTKTLFPVHYHTGKYEWYSIGIK